MTKLIGITMVKNEADFIEYFVRHNFRILDELYIADDQSSDNTPEIISSLKQEGMKIELLPIEDRKTKLLYLQSQAMTRLMRYSATKQGTKECYILPLDADEIILGNREEIISQLRALAPDEYGLIKWKTFAPINGGLNTGKPVTSFFKPLLIEQRVFYKVIVPIQHSKSATIAMGNHRISCESAQLKPRKLNLELGHFPVRSADQIIAKALVTSHKIHLKNGAQTGEGYHIRALADHLRKLDYKPTEQELTDAALKYLNSNNSAEIDFDFNMEDAFPAISPNYIANRINPIRALDELLLDIITTRTEVA